MSLFGMPEGTPCCCGVGCCPNTTLPDCIQLDLTASCCDGETANVILTNESAPSACDGGEKRPFTGSESFCTEAPKVIYTGALPSSFCSTLGLGDTTVNIFCCIDSVTGEENWWIYIGDITDASWYPATHGRYYPLTLVSCDPLLLRIDADPPDCSAEVCIWTWQAACFVEGTLVRTPIGEVPIERIAVGDSVLDVFGRTVQVLAVYPSDVETLMELTNELGIVTGVTPEHPFILDDMKTVIAAGNLTPGTQLPFGKIVTAVRQFNATGPLFRVVNLHVSGSNTFVADGYAVHNKGQS